MQHCHLLTGLICDTGSICKATSSQKACRNMFFCLDLLFCLCPPALIHRVEQLGPVQSCPARPSSVCNSETQFQTISQHARRRASSGDRSLLGVLWTGSWTRWVLLHAVSELTARRGLPSFYPSITGFCCCCSWSDRSSDGHWCSHCLKGN